MVRSAVEQEQITKFVFTHGGKTILNETNLGFAKANNQGLSMATGRYCLLLNNDTLVAENALVALVRAMDQSPQVGRIGADLVNPDLSLQFSHDIFPLHLWQILWRSLTRLGKSKIQCISEVEEPRAVDAAGLQDVDRVLGASMMVRPEVVSEIGGLDEGYFMYAEDIDFCFRASKQGWRIAFMPGARIIHFGSASVKREGSAVQESYRAMRDASLLRFYRIHHGRTAEVGMRLILAAHKKLWPLCKRFHKFR